MRGIHRAAYDGCTARLLIKNSVACESKGLESKVSCRVFNHDNLLSSAFASRKSAVSNPSVNSR